MVNPEKLLLSHILYGLKDNFIWNNISQIPVSCLWGIVDIAVLVDHSKFRSLFTSVQMNDFTTSTLHAEWNNTQGTMLLDYLIISLSTGIFKIKSHEFRAAK